MWSVVSSINVIGVTWFFFDSLSLQVIDRVPVFPSYTTSVLIQESMRQKFRVYESVDKVVT